MGNVGKNGTVPASAVVLLAIVLVAAVVGTVFYYNQLINEKDAKIDSLNTQITDLNKQVGSLNLPNLVTSLAIGVEKNANLSVNGAEMNGNALFITGSITNQGKTTAHNVRLYVVAKDVYGATVIDMTVPLGGNFVVNEDPSLLSAGTTIDAIQTAKYVNIRILCHETPVSWNVTPVYS